MDKTTVTTVGMVCITIIIGFILLHDVTVHQLKLGTYDATYDVRNSPTNSIIINRRGL